MTRAAFSISLCSLTLPTILLAPAVGLAEEPIMLEEVIVTANRRESALMETATSISAFDSATRSELGIDNQYDLAVHTPSLTIAPSRVSIRGVGRPNIALGTDPGVGLYWDGVYTTETDLFNFSNFLDIDRIEVLRGPQGTLYGRNSIGGAINIISTRPDPEQWGGKVIAEVGNYDYYVLQGLASGPVTKKLSALVALSQVQRDGLQENEGSNLRFDQEERTYGTIDLHHQTTDRWSNELKAMKKTSDIRRSQPYVLDPFNTELRQVVNDVNTGDILNFPGNFPDQNFANPNQGMTRQNPALRDENDVSVDYNPSETNDRWSATFISEYEADSFTIKYTGGYSEFNYEEDFDADGIKAEDSGLDWSQLNWFGVPVSVASGTGYTLTPAFTTRPFSLDSRTQSHELQFISDFGGNIDVIGGLYYYNSNETQRLSFIEHNQQLMEIYEYFGGFIDGPVSSEGYLFRGEAKLETTSYAAYGQMNWSVTDSTILTLGLRYTLDEKDGTDNTFVQYVGDPNDPTVYRSAKDSWDKVTWRVGIDQFIAENHFVYGFVATGFRSGGFNLMAPTDTTDVDTVDPENLLSYEIGYKGSLLDQRLNLTTAAYYYDYTDIQVRKDDLINGVEVPTFENAADANAWGLEAEFLALITNWFNMSGTWSYNKTEYEDYESIDTNACALGPLTQGNSQAPLCTQPQNLKGNEFALSPQQKASLNLIYLWEVFSLDWRAVVSYQYTGEQYITAFNNDQYDKLDGWDRWDARLTLASPKLTWELTGYVKNIGGDRQQLLRDRPDTVSQLAEVRLADPRVYGLRFTYNF